MSWQSQYVTFMLQEETIVTIIYSRYLTDTYDTIMHIAMIKFLYRFALINATPYLALMGELWGAFHEL